MAVITISRQLGSEGTYIAGTVAERLGYQLVDKNAIEEVLREYGLVQFKYVYESVLGFWARVDKLTVQSIALLNQIFLALASRGEVVIIGRGSFAVLAGFSDVLNVRIQAPLAARVQRVMARENIAEPDQAQALVKESDRVRSAFVESFYGVRWDEAAAFDLVVDTGKIAPDIAVTWLVQAHAALTDKQAGNALTTRTIEVDPTLAKVIATTLAGD
jgi:cytidylate kinase